MTPPVVDEIIDELNKRVSEAYEKESRPCTSAALASYHLGARVALESFRHWWIAQQRKERG